MLEPTALLPPDLERRRSSGYLALGPGDLLLMREIVALIVGVTRHRLTGSWEADVLRVWPEFGTHMKYPLFHLQQLDPDDLSVIAHGR